MPVEIKSNYSRIYNAVILNHLSELGEIFFEIGFEKFKDAVNFHSTEHIASPLIMAARNGYKHIVDYLLQHGAEPKITGIVLFDGETICGVSPLWVASAAGYLEICKLLVEAGADVNQPSNTNSTPLRSACYDGHIEIVKFLVENGANIEIPNKHGHTSLMIACFRGHENVVRYLISIGAKLDQKSIKGNTAFHDAAETGNIEILQLLHDAKALYQKDDSGCTPLMSAAISMQIKAVEFLLRYANLEERRDAWKLLGASLVDRKNNLYKAIQCWKKAFLIQEYCWPKNGTIFQQQDVDMATSTSRFCGGKRKLAVSPEEDKNLIKISILNGDSSKSFDSPMDMDLFKERIYEGHREATCLHEVLRLVGDPEAIRNESLVIRERILGDRSEEFFACLRSRGLHFYEISGLEFDRAFDIWLYLLQLQQHYGKPISSNSIIIYCDFAQAFCEMADQIFHENEWQNFPDSSKDKFTVEQLVILVERIVYDAERFLRKYNLMGEAKDEDDLDSDDEQILEKNLETMLHISLLLLQMAYVLELNNACVNCHPSTSKEDFPSNNNPSFKLNLPEDFCRKRRGRKFCRHALIDLSRSQNLLPKFQFTSEILPCKHLNCLIRRLVFIFESLNISPLLVASKNLHLLGISESPDWKTDPSIFIISRLIEAGANFNAFNEEGENVLHIHLGVEIPQIKIIRLLLNNGVPLLSRNSHRKSVTAVNLMNKLNSIPFYRIIAEKISLKEIAAHKTVQNLSDIEELDKSGILPLDLIEYLRKF